MCVAYLTIDEVNDSLVRSFAAQSSLDVCLVQPKDEAIPEDLTAVVLDLDNLPTGHLERLLAEATQGERPCPVAVHGYNLEARQVHLLRDAGVIVRRRLGTRLFRRLASALRRPGKPQGLILCRQAKALDSHDYPGKEEGHTRLCRDRKHQVLREPVCHRFAGWHRGR